MSSTTSPYEYAASGLLCLGHVPKHWKVGLKLRHLAANSRGSFVNGPFGSDLLAEELRDEGVPVIYIRDINPKGYRRKSTVFVSISKAMQLDTCRVDQGDVLVSKVGDPPGDACVYPPGFSSAIVTQDVIRIRVDPELVSAHFLSNLLNTDFGRAAVDNISVESTRKRVALGDYKQIRLFLPPLEEQTKIANFLDYETAKIDALIEKQQQLIALLQEKRQAVISHAVTKGLDPNVPIRDSGVEWLGDVPAHWKTTKLGYRYEILLGKMLDARKISGKCLGKYLRNTDIQWDQVNEENLPEMDFLPHERDRYSVQFGDLIVCEGGEVGRAAIWNRSYPCFYQKALHRVRPKQPSLDHPRFLFYHLLLAASQQRFQASLEKATIAHLPAEAFRQYRFTFPPFEEQLAIASFLDNRIERLSKLESKAFGQIDLLQEKRTTLISAAVTGKIDVRGWTPPESADEASPS